MTTITKERLLTIKQWRETYGPGSNVVLPAEEAEELARIALASLEAKPIGAFHIAEQQVDGTSDYIKDGEWPIDNGTIEVYAAPPAPVVPEEKPMPNPLGMYAVDAVAAIAEVRGWNACRAAMLQSGNFRENNNSSTNNFREISETSTNYPVTPDGWISCSERMPDDGQHVIILCDGAFVLYAQYRDGEFFDVVRNGDEFFETQSRNVTDWMPLPEPPQEVRQ
ncbi:DUF551 domain-containing protein [Escherichia coli]|nr:DUF551 domain-containing protein [Escherichia coli]EES1003957.1 DUF551 domain-containing protein [Escherichia coli]EET4850063.1 DUF551 domain-containing protein [Escherichia coli]EFB7704450.1 DUF551 domain-containing protein [Escherichia coli]EFI4787711.1 DUF551 domain-containing protein [Escherichia coli]